MITIANRLTIDDVRSFIERNDLNNDCTLISNEYINNHTKLTLKCNRCGELFERDYAHIRRGRFMCERCGELKGAKKLEYSVEEVDKKISERGYMRTGEYTNAGTPFDAICKRGHKCSLIFTHFLNGHSGCRMCHNIENSGENHYNWKGGKTEIIDFFRKTLTQWKKDIMKRDGYKCVYTGDTDFVIHHLKSFNTILQEASDITGIPILAKISDYEEPCQLEKLREKFLELHTLDNGITISRTLHNQFHSIYGKGNNTKEQFFEFISKNNYKE